MVVDRIHSILMVFSSERVWKLMSAYDTRHCHAIGEKPIIAQMS